MGRRGLTLPELILALALTAFLLTMGAVRFSSGVSAAQNSAVAQILASELREARQRAMTSGFPVAVAFPSQGRSRWACQSFYRLEGSLPKRTRLTQLASQHPRSLLVLASCSATDRPGPSPSDTTTYQNWIAQVTDPALIYLPSGRLQSNGMPNTQGLYQILISEGATLAPSPLGGGWLKPVQVSRPYLVQANALGSVRVTQTLAGASLSANPLPFPAVAQASAAAPVSNRAPSARLEVWPKPNPTTLAPNAEVAINRESFLTLEVRASDADADPLQCNWTCSGGGFSCPGTEEMHWDPTQSNWFSRWEWKPPASGRSGDLFRLQCSVTDPSGAAAQPSATCRLTWDVALTEGHIAMAGSGGSDGITLMNADGTCKTQVYSERVGQFQAYKVAWHPDSTRLFVSLNPNYSQYTYTPSLYQIRIPGNLQSSPVNAQNLGFGSDPTLSPDGKYQIFLGTGPFGLYRHTIGTPLTQAVLLLPQAAYAGDPDWNNRGVLCTRHVGPWVPTLLAPGVPTLHYIPPGEVLNPSNGGYAQTVSLNQVGINPTWSPDGSRVAFIQGYQPGQPSSLWVAQFQDAPPRLTNLQQVVTPSFVGSFCWSPDSSRLAYLGVDQGVRAVLEVPATANAVPRVLRRSSNMFSEQFGRPSWFRR